jgi:hypothetical protein
MSPLRCALAPLIAVFLGPLAAGDVVGLDLRHGANHSQVVAHGQGVGKRASGGPDVLAKPEEAVANPDEQEKRDREEGGGKQFNFESEEGGNQHSLSKWRLKKGGGPVSEAIAIMFICLIGAMPVLLGYLARRVTRTQLIESAFLYVWLFGGLYLFTEVLIFQSPHFAEPRSLSVEEAAYLYAQILTTVGYGDITPARPRGQLFVGMFVLLAVILVANVISEMLDFFAVQMEKRMQLCDDARQTSSKQRLKDAFEPVIFSSLVFCCFVCAGVLFYSLYPGENKTPAQAVYMALITLCTVGFGAFTPQTHAGMVFGAYWMLFGTTAMAAMVTSRIAFSLALKQHEIRNWELQTGQEHEGKTTTKLHRVREQQRKQKRELWG